MREKEGGKKERKKRIVKTKSRGRRGRKEILLPIDFSLLDFLSSPNHPWKEGEKIEREEKER